MKLQHTLLLACLSTAPLCAQQVESKAEVKQDAAAATASGEASATVTEELIGRRKTEARSTKPGRNAPPAQPSRPPPPGQPTKQQPVAYIGVLTRDVTPELRSQFSLPEGFGLMVEEIMPGSPAEQAGLKVHDILLKLDDQQLITMEQLMALVRARKKGEVVQLTRISGGKESQLPVTLGEHLMPERTQHGFGGWPQGGMPFLGGDPARGSMYGYQNQGKETQEQMERFQQEMREFQQRMQDWAKSDHSTPMPQVPRLNHQPLPRSGPAKRPQPPGDNRQELNITQSHAANHITRRDDSGEYSLKTEDGRTTFTARPNGGTEQSWPVNNDTERKAVPEAFRDKVRMMDGAGGGIRIEVRPGPGDKPDAPRPQGKNTSA